MNYSSFYRPVALPFLTIILYASTAPAQELRPKSAARQIAQGAETPCENPTGDQSTASSFRLAQLPALNTTNETSTRMSFGLPEFAPAYITFGTSPDNLNTTGSKENSSKYKIHNQTLSNLVKGQRYYFSIRSGKDYASMSRLYSFVHPGASGQAEVNLEKVDPTPKKPVTETPPPPTATTITLPTPTPGVGAGEITSSAGKIFVAVGGSGDGTSVNSPLGNIQRALDIAQPGQIVFVKAGNYGDQPLKFPRDGKSGKPIVLEGYRNAPGDSPSYSKFDHTSSINSSLMPLLDGGSRSHQGMAVGMYRKYIALKNFQITNFRHAVYGYGPSNVTVDNVVAVGIGDPNKTYNGHGIHFGGNAKKMLVRNSTVINATAEAITFSGTNSILEFNKVYCDDNSQEMNSNTDYYFILSGSYDNIVRNNYIERVGNLRHGGHGFSVKRNNERNLFEHNTAVNIGGGGYVVRWQGTKNNIFRNNKAIRGSGILARDGAEGNLFENMTIQDTRRGIWIADTGEDSTNTTKKASIRNTFRNITMKNVSVGIEYDSYAGRTESHSENDIFDNITIDGAPTMFIVGHHTKNITFKNSKIKNVSTWATPEGARNLGEFDIKTSNNVVEDRKFSIP
ncbi:MAG: right-handed parallel beta-helix repeat-containing protein [Verrucomicrobiales bacterium]|nr:right-handed parallel beta-helix repeat-containing protein [Verrucomicrobiales bacterium]